MPHAVDDEHLARLDVAHVLGADEVEGARLAGDDVRVLLRGEEAEAEGPDAHGVAHGDDRLLRHEEQRVGALHARERVGDAVLDGDLLARRDEVHEHLGVGVALEDRPARLELGPQLFGVRQVAVVADGERAARVVDRDGLGVLDVRAAGRRVADVADRDATRELGELLLRERVLHEPHGAVRVERLAVGRDDARRLLPAVLQRVKAEVGHVGGFGVAEDAEDAAFVAEVVVLQELASRPWRGPGAPRRMRMRTTRHPGHRIEDDEAALAVGHSATWNLTAVAAAGQR